MWVVGFTIYTFQLFNIGLNNYGGVISPFIDDCPVYSSSP